MCLDGPPKREEVNYEWKEEGSDYCLKMLTGFGGTLFLILNLIQPYILVSCKFSWLRAWNGIMELSADMAHTSRLKGLQVAECFQFKLAGMSPDFGN